MPAEIENATPDLPVANATADRGDDFSPTPMAPVELTAEELEAIGKGPAKEAAKEPAKEVAAADPDAPAKEGAEAAKEPAKDEAPRDDKGKFIPKARFDEVNNKARARVAALEGTIKQLNERLGVVEGKAPDTTELETQLDTKSEEYGQLLADGDLVAAKAVLREINQLNRKIGAIENAALSTSHQAEGKQVDALGELVLLYKDAYPVFDETNKELYNQEYVDFVARLQGKFEVTGSSPAEALREAVELAVAKFGLDPEPEAPAADPAVPNKGQERKAAAVAKAVKAQGAQPAALAKVGDDSDTAGMSKIDVSSLSYEAFERLPESTKARLRGDFA